MFGKSLLQVTILFSIVITTNAQQDKDALGVGGGFVSYNTGTFSVKLVNNSQTLASLISLDDNGFDFLPNKTLLAFRASDGQHQLGDVVLRYRVPPGHGKWTARDSATARHPVTRLNPSNSTDFSYSDLAPTLDGSSIEVLRTWTALDSGDLSLSFSFRNTENASLELGGLGFPFVSDSIFTNRTAVDINANCSLIDPYIGLDGGYLRFTRVNGKEPAMVVTPMNRNSSFEGWGFLHESMTGSNALGYQTESFEGYYQYMPLTLAYAEEEWNATQPWNEPTSMTLQPNETMMVGFRFTLVKEVQDIENVASSLGIPTVKGLPGYILPNDLEGHLFLNSSQNVSKAYIEPAGSLKMRKVSKEHLVLLPQANHSGRTRLTIEYEDGRNQSVHYYLTKSAPQAVADLGKFLNDRHWWTNTSDPFGRAPSFMCVDHSDGVGSLVLEDYLARVWLSGECHEAGASWYTMALKQAAQADADQVARLEAFIDKVLWKTIQLPDYAVRQSIFWYDPNITDFVYSPAYPWWPDTTKNYSVSWSKARADVTTRAYGYTYPATTYWALYRAGRASPSMLKQHPWEWYLNQSYQTLVYCFQEVNGTHAQPLWLDGLMGETAFGEIFKDLYREGWTSQAIKLENLMRERVQVWANASVPFGSELGWDCTGQEGVFYWSNFFADVATVNKTISTILGYMPLVPHWGYNGNARRYWDFQFDGKIDRIERQIHHYGSALNALPLLGFIHSYPTLATDYLTRLAFGGLFAPLSNIHDDGFASTAFHSWPETLAWDNYTGDYGPAFAGLVLGSATYVLRDNVTTGNLRVYGGLWNFTESLNTTQYTVWPRDALRRRVYIGPLMAFVEIDAGAIDTVTVDEANKTVTISISNRLLPNAALAPKCILWYNQELYVDTSNDTSDVVVTSASGDAFTRERAGWVVPLIEKMTDVRLQVA